MCDAIIISYELFLYQENFIQEQEKNKKQCFYAFFVFSYTLTSENFKEKPKFFYIAS